MCQNNSQRITQHKCMMQVPQNKRHYHFFAILNNYKNKLKRTCARLIKYTYNYVVVYPIAMRFKLIPLFEVLFFLICILLLPIARCIPKQKSLKKMRVFIGINEISGNIKNIQIAFNTLGIKTDSLTTKHPFYADYPYTETFSISNKKEVWGGLIDIVAPFQYFWFCIKKIIQIIFSYDLVCFNWRFSFLIFNLDWLLFKLAGIKVCVIHCGDEVRFRPIQNKKNQQDERIVARILPEEPHLLTKRYFLNSIIAQKTGEWLSHYLFSDIGQATFLSKPVYQFQIPFPKNVEQAKAVNKTVSFVHAPSDRNIKDTETIISAVKALQHEGYIFNFTLLENKPQTEILEHLIQADILIDQPNLSLGSLSKEALSCGCFLITGNHTIWKNKIPNLSFERSNVALLKQNMVQCIQNKKWLQSQMDASYEAYTKYLGPDAFFHYIDGILNNAVEKTVKPLQNQKVLCLKYTRNNFEKFFIHLLM
jgi:hypothetical protein